MASNRSQLDRTSCNSIVDSGLEADAYQLISSYVPDVSYLRAWHGMGGLTARNRPSATEKPLDAPWQSRAVRN